MIGIGFFSYENQNTVGFQFGVNLPAVHASQMDKWRFQIVFTVNLEYLRT